MKAAELTSFLFLCALTLSSPLAIQSTVRPALGDASIFHEDLIGDDVDDNFKREIRPVVTSTLNKRQNFGVISQMVSYHNAYRTHHGAQKMAWDTTLAQFAQTSAQKCVFAHTSSDPYGENIAAGTYTNPAYYVYLWYKEVNQYNFNAPAYSDSTGHFTQLVWNASTHLGCAWVTGCAGSYPNMLFCEYGPRGNVNPAPNFATNVGKPKASPANPAVPAMNA